MSTRPGLFAEHPEQRLPPALRRLAKSDEVVELRRLDPLTLVGRPALQDLAPSELDVSGAVECEGFRRQSVAPRAADLLIIGFD